MALILTFQVRTVAKTRKKPFVTVAARNHFGTPPPDSDITQRSQ
jgi:hypothetical protein